jgi:integrase
MLIGELLALRWQDVDLETERAALRVRRTKSTAKSGPVFTTPKNGKGRSIRLTRHAVEALKAHRAAQNAERLKAGTLWQDTGLVFCTHGGNHWNRLNGGPGYDECYGTPGDRFANCELITREALE